jgi:hypothetical protein
LLLKSGHLAVVSVIDAWFTTSSTAVFRIWLLRFVFYAGQEQIFNVLLSAKFAVAFDGGLDGNDNFRLERFLSETSFFLLF